VSCRGGSAATANSLTDSCNAVNKGGDGVICFEIQINGKVVCTAGIGDFGVLTSNLAWVKVHPSKRAKETQPFDLFLTVGGLTSTDKDEGEHLRWLDQQPLAPGDEIVIRLLEQATCDVPRDRFRDE